MILCDGPTMTLSPHQENAFAQFPSQSLLDLHSPALHGYPASPSSVFANAGAAQSILTNAPVSHAPMAPKPSRKRSRDDAAFEETPAPSMHVYSKPAPVPKEEPIYGEGMVLLNPQTGVALPAESQTGTWYEEENESEQASAPPVSSRSNALPSDAADLSRKSQRLDTSAPGLDDIAMHQRLNGSVSDEQRRTLHTEPPTEPHVDDATRLLGISWQCIGTDDDMAPAVRGWTKYIDNQYSAHLHDSQMLMKNRALNTYLVAATPVSALSPAFYLFSEDLGHAQLVASSWEACLQNLHATPIIFEGAASVVAADRSDGQLLANPFTANSVGTGIPLLQQALSAHAHAPPSIDAGVGLSGGLDMGMEIDS